MAWSFTAHRGSANSKTSGAVLSVAPTGTIAAGAIAVAVGVSDNIVTGGGASSSHVVTDFRGNLWTKVVERSNAAAAGGGITASIWASQLTTQLTTSDSIVFGLPSAVTSRAIGIYEYAIGAGSKLAIISAAGSEQDNTSAPTVTLNGLNSDVYALFGATAREDDNISTYTMDADYNDRTKFGTTGGTAATNASCVVGDRLATLTGDTFAPTALQASSDVVTLLCALKEVVPITLSCTKVIQPGTGRVYVNWSDGVQSEFASLQDAKEATDNLTIETLRALAIARYLSVDPTAATPSLLEGHSINYSANLNRMVEVF